MAKSSRRKLSPASENRLRNRRRAQREAIEDRIDVLLAKKALKEKGSIPWAKAMKELGLK